MTSVSFDHVTKRFEKVVALDDLTFEVMDRELEKGRNYYEKNVDPSVRAQTDYFDQAVVDILVKGHGKVESKIW